MTSWGVGFGVGVALGAGQAWLLSRALAALFGGGGRWAALGAARIGITASAGAAGVLLLGLSPEALGAGLALGFLGCRLGWMKWTRLDQRVAPWASENEEGASRA